MLALHILDMDNLADTPEVEDKVACLHNVSSKVIDKVFQSASSVVQNITKAGERTQNESYPFCVCKLEKPGAVMVFCNNRNCQRGVWFHIECVNMEEEDIPEGAWYCSGDCEQEKSTRRIKKKTTANSLTDFKMDYVLLLIWRGLSQMSRKDAIRENNGKTRNIGARTKVMGRKNFHESINYFFHKQKVTVYRICMSMSSEEILCLKPRENI